MLFATILAMVFSFLAGIIGLISSIKKKANLKSYLKSSLGIIMLIPVVMAFAIPMLYRSATRAKQGEAKWYLEEIYNDYSAYHRKHHTYPIAPSIQVGDTVLDCFQIVGWKPRGNIRYNYNCMNIEAFSPAVNDSPCPPGIVTAATKDSFTVAACGNIDNDTTVDVWTINDSKKLKNVIDDVKN